MSAWGGQMVSHYTKKGRLAMSREVSRKQSHQVMATLAVNTDWSELTTGQVQEIIDDPINSGRQFTRFLAGSGRPTNVSIEGIDLPLPKNGKIHILSIPFDGTRSWDEAVRAAGPDTSLDSIVYKYHYAYPPKVVPPIRQLVILVNFSDGFSSNWAVMWGRERYLRPAMPRTCLAIGEHRPNLNRDLGVDFMGVVSLADPCMYGGTSFHTYVWWQESRRRICAKGFESFWGANYEESFWVAFVHETSLQPSDSKL